MTSSKAPGAPWARTLRLAALTVMLSAAGCGDDPQPAASDWVLALEHLPAALISVTGSAADDVYAVGANLSGQYREPIPGVTGPLVLHYDGDGFTRIPIDADAHLWWVHMATPDEVFVSGTEGTVLRGNARDGFEPLDTPGTDTVFGMWGQADDLWLVGGEPEVTPGFVWRYDGTTVRDVTAELPMEVEPIFKVFGHAADDVWLVGAEGLAIHWDGAAFTIEDPDTERRLFTVHGPAEGEPSLVAVGGYADGVIVEHDGTAWHDDTPENAPEVFCVFMTGDGTGIAGYAVGVEGAVMERDMDAWHSVETGLDLIDPFHAVWVDPEGGVWATGGDVLTPLLNEGMLLHHGETLVTEIEGL